MTDFNVIPTYTFSEVHCTAYKLINNVIHILLWKKNLQKSADASSSQVSQMRFNREQGTKSKDDKGEDKQRAAKHDARRCETEHCHAYYIAIYTRAQWAIHFQMGHLNCAISLWVTYCISAYNARMEGERT